MTATPWGDADRLRSRQLRPGPGASQQAVVENQRERLFAATVAVVAEKGYDAARVEDILVRAGVSRNTFYRYFSNKLDCFHETLAAIVDFVAPIVVDAFESAPGPWDRKLAVALDSLATLIVAQPATARAAWVEVYAGGLEAVEIVERLDAQLEDVSYRALRESPERSGMPREIVRAVVGGLRKMIHARVRQDRTAELPELMPQMLAWLSSYHTPPQPLLRPRRVPAGLVVSPPPPRDARERILVAVAEIVGEKSYAEMAITEIATRASVSLTTFYEHFDGKEEAFVATLADLQQRIYEAILPHFAAAPDWPTAVADALRAFFAFISTHSTVARFGGGIGIWATSPAGLEQRAQGVAVFSALLDEGLRQNPDTVPLAIEGVSATVDALVFNLLRHRSVEDIYALAPTAIFITLAPFVGNERACELAVASPDEIGQTSL